MEFGYPYFLVERIGSEGSLYSLPVHVVKCGNLAVREGVVCFPGVKDSAAVDV